MESSSKGATDVNGTLEALFDLTLGSGADRIRSSITMASEGGHWTETQRRLEQCVDLLQEVLAYSKTLQQSGQVQAVEEHKQEEPEPSLSVEGPASQGESSCTGFWSGMQDGLTSLVFSFLSGRPNSERLPVLARGEVEPCRLLRGLRPEEKGGRTHYWSLVSRYGRCLWREKAAVEALRVVEDEQEIVDWLKRLTVVVEVHDTQADKSHLCATGRLEYRVHRGEIMAVPAGAESALVAFAPFSAAMKGDYTDVLDYFSAKHEGAWRLRTRVVLQDNESRRMAVLCQSGAGTARRNGLDGHVGQDWQARLYSTTDDSIRLAQVSTQPDAAPVPLDISFVMKFSPLPDQGQVARPQRAYQFAKRMPFYIKFRTESLSLVGAAVKSLHWV